MTARDIINQIVQSVGNIDDEILIKIYRRNSANIVEEVAYLPIDKIDSFDNICIEESKITFQPYESNSQYVNQFKKVNKLNIVFPKIFIRSYPATKHARKITPTSAFFGEL